MQQGQGIGAKREEERRVRRMRTEAGEEKGEAGISKGEGSQPRKYSLICSHNCKKDAQVKRSK